MWALTVGLGVGVGVGLVLWCGGGVWGWGWGWCRCGVGDRGFGVGVGVGVGFGFIGGQVVDVLDGGAYLQVKLVPRLNYNTLGLSAVEKKVRSCAVGELPLPLPCARSPKQQG
jgi:hypothetical protein